MGVVGVVGDMVGIESVVSCDVTELFTISCLNLRVILQINSMQLPPIYVWEF
jgi:hypothetical protein